LAACRRIIFKPGLCECNEHRGTPRFRDEREEHKKAQGRVENDRLLADESFSSQTYVSATNIEEPQGSEMSARSVKKAQCMVGNDRLHADGSFSSQDYVSATNIEEPKGSEMSARSGRTADRRTYNE
jgi:hypothetical protein